MEEYTCEICGMRIPSYSGCYARREGNMIICDSLLCYREAIKRQGTVDGMDVSDHSARHENCGADEINVTDCTGGLPNHSAGNKGKKPVKRKPNAADKKIIRKMTQFGKEMGKIPFIGDSSIERIAGEKLAKHNITEYATPEETADHARNNNWLRYKVGDLKNGINLGDFYIKAVISENTIYELPTDYENKYQ